MATFVNDLRLTELATGEGSGTWGTTTNTNLELIAESFSFGTEAITTNADTHTTTIADGSTDPGRSLFLKYTGTLDSACTITIGPNTVSKLWFIENATSGSQSIIIKQGSGATITIPNGQTKAIYSDGAGSGGAMVDAFTDLSVPSFFVSGDLDVDGTTNLDVVDIDGAVDMASTLAVGGVVTVIDGSTSAPSITNAGDSNSGIYFPADDQFGIVVGGSRKLLANSSGIAVNNGSLTSDGGVVIDNITIDGTEIDLSSGDLTIDVAGDIILDADGGDVFFKDGGSTFGSLSKSSTRFTVDAPDNPLRVVSGTSNIQINHDTHITLDTAGAERVRVNTSEMVINEDSNNYDFRVESDGNTHMLFVDAGNDTVVIGSGSVTAPSTIDFLSYASSAAGRSAFVHASGDGGIVVSGTGSGSAASVIFGNDYGSDGSGFTEEYRLIMDGSDDSLQFKYNGNASTALTLSSAGVATFGGAVNTGGNLSVTGQGDFSTSVLVGTNNSTFSENNLRFLSSGDAFIDHSTTGQKFQFRPSVSSSLDRTALVVGGTEVVVNESSDDTDFRVESDSNTNALFVDAGENKVGIGTSSPATGTHSSYSDLVVGETTSSTSGISLKASTSGNSAIFFSDGASPFNRGQILYDHSDDSLAFSAAGSEAMSLENDSLSVITSDTTASLNVGGDTNGALNVLRLSNDDTTYSQNFIFNLDTDKNLVVTGASGGGGIKFNAGTNGFIVNENSNDMDFRVESDSSANMLFVDAANNRVFINSAATSITKFQDAQFAIGGNSAFRVLGISGTGANDTGISVNAGGIGMAMLVIGSRNTGAGTNTASGMYLLNFAYDGDNTPTSTHIAGTNFLTFGKSSGNDLTITNAGSGNCAVLLMMIG